MFEFGFSSDNNRSDIIPENESRPDLDWLPAKEILLNESNDDYAINKKEIQTMDINHLTLKYLVYSDMKNIPRDGSVLEEYRESDLIPAKYEGGMKVWECTYDLANFLTAPDCLVDIQNKTVLDLGCGSGILGMLALHLGAERVHFQDYNESVLRLSTVPNLFLNGFNGQSCKYFSGDWASFVSLNDQLYDVILTCETIYNIENYQKLHEALRLKLKRGGIVLLAAKTYYFGVGGGTRQFESLVEKEGVFDSAVKWKCSTGVHREILEFKFKKS